MMWHNADLKHKIVEAVKIDNQLKYDDQASVRGQTRAMKRKATTGQPKTDGITEPHGMAVKIIPPTEKEAIEYLKKLGYKIQKPTITFEEV